MGFTKREKLITYVKAFPFFVRNWKNYIIMDVKFKKSGVENDLYSNIKSCIRLCGAGG